MIVGAPKRGATTAVMTMVTAGALMYRPERVQFYCIAASGPQLAVWASCRTWRRWCRCSTGGGQPAAGHRGPDRRGARADLRRAWAGHGRRCVGPSSAAGRRHQRARGAAVAGGDVVVVVDGWANFAEAMPKHVDTVMASCAPATTGCGWC